jgi:hypothetical protein
VDAVPVIGDYEAFSEEYNSAQSVVSVGWNICSITMWARMLTWSGLFFFFAEAVDPTSQPRATLLGEVPYALAIVW